MVPSQTFESFPVFSDTGTKVKPGDAKYSAGFQQSDVLPAEWVNWEWNKASKGVTDLNTGLTSVEAEINSVLTGAGKSPDATKTNQLLESIAKLIDDAETRAKLAAHPIGSLYWSSNSTDPGQLFGGTWAPIKDCFVWAKGDSDTVNATGGAKTVTLLVANLPSHSHTIGGNTGGSYAQLGASSGPSGVTTSFSTASGGSHRHDLFGASSGNNMQSKYWAISTYALIGYASGGAYASKTAGDNYLIQSGGSHSHTIYQSTHTHTLPANTGSSGSGTAVDKMPPYIIKYCWERTA